MKSITIGNIKIKNRLFLAPMVEVTDVAYRMLCRKAGAAMAYTEMVYIDALLHENKKTLAMIKTTPRDTPLGIQLTGDSPDEFNQLSVSKNEYSLIDINCGCPSIRIVGTKAGSYLLNDPSKIAKMITILKKKDYIVTAKIRLGFSENKVLSIAKIIEEAGADALTVHARLATQKSSIPADLSQIEKVKKHIGIPVIGNGDIFSGKSAESILDIADAAMIARGAIGDPLIFSRIQYYLKTKKEQAPQPSKNFAQFKEYLKLQKKYYPEPELQKIKHVGGNFIKNVPGAPGLRDQLMKLKTFSEIQSFVSDLSNTYKE